MALLPVTCRIPNRQATPRQGVLEPVLQRGRRAVKLPPHRRASGIASASSTGQFYAAFPAGHATAAAALRRLNRFQASNRFYAANRELGRTLKTAFVLQSGLSFRTGRVAGT